MVSTWLIRGGRVVDPANNRDEVTDVLIREGHVAAVAPISDADGAEVVDATGLVVAPGFIDVHVHLRDPGFPEKETIATGTAAAAAGGFTTVCCMPNTRPALDSVAKLRQLHGRVTRDARVRVHPIAAITKGRKGRRAVDFPALVAEGAIGFSDDGGTTRDSAIMRMGLEASKVLNRPIMVHCEDEALAQGAMNEGEVSRRLGIPGMPAEAEEIVIARDLLLARLTGGWLHVCHVSTGYGAELVRRAKAEGLHVTAEVTPHHLLMSDEWVAGDRTLLHVDEPAGTQGTPGDPNTKVNPPLRTKEDARQLLEALKDGTIDVIATDHAPHTPEDKKPDDFGAAEFGLSGLEFALPLMLALVRTGHLDLGELITKMSFVPATLLRARPRGSLSIGAPADLVVFDPEEQWVISPIELQTMNANTPLLGRRLQGRVRLTLVGGEERYRRGFP